MDTQNHHCLFSKHISITDNSTLSFSFSGINFISSFNHLSAGGAEAVLVCADAMPTEAADLVAAGAGEEVDVINLQRLHAQWALHWVVLHFRAVGHPMARQG